MALMVTAALTACSSSAKEFNFDDKSWKNDLNGCKGDRVKLTPQVETFRMKLLTRKEYVIRGLFGKPDAEELLERSQKIYIYYISPGPKCANGNKDGQNQKALSVRFDALGKVREIMLHDTY
ncbi:hypothetical protein TH61_14510 [Rufibacter sp. DG15C]|uniref:hypothetical protein n=1 Tax=Rufibacter sp. DG15C TaxID=1379909 RepID=UPI00078E4E61|nr:hypothetical protein [Rufibacter sp. DG15C]AMM52154.1 hypothetical protein TH61_14510 [Rufibacter sp. DG15C]